MDNWKKYLFWLKEITRWQQKDEKPLNIRSHRHVKKIQGFKFPSKRYYVGKLYPEVYLTPRELEIAVLLLQGKRYKAIGQQLSLSFRTVEYYIQNLRLKFHCPDKKSLVKILEKIGLLST